MNIKEMQGAQGYSVFNVEGIRIDPNGYEPKVAAGVYSLLKNMHENNGLDGLSTKEDIIKTIKEGVNGNGTPSMVDVAKKFPDYIAKHLLNAE